MLRVFTDSDGNFGNPLGGDQRQQVEPPRQAAAGSPIGLKPYSSQPGSTTAHATIHSPHQKFRSPDARPWGVTGSFCARKDANTLCRRHRPGELPR